MGTKLSKISLLRILIGVHVNLYMKTIKNLGTEKHAGYLLKAAQFKEFGSFSMTELAHGSNV